MNSFGVSPTTEKAPWASTQIEYICGGSEYLVLDLNLSFRRVEVDILIEAWT
jgi:hypothetical protein